MSLSLPGGINLLSREPQIKVLHFTWIAFFVSFMVWFNQPPLMGAIQASLDLSKAEVGALLTLNVALAIPARIVVGMLVDKFGPRLVYAILLITAGLLCLFYATADSFTALAVTRLLLGLVGAGFVVGIRLIGEWFPAKQIGLAEGIYGGWGNFGSAAAAVTLPTLALIIGGPEGWRWAIAATGLVAIVYGVFYYFAVRDTPKGSTYFKPKKVSAIEVTSKGDLALCMFMQLPLYLALGLLTWKLGPGNLNFLNATGVLLVDLFLSALAFAQILQIWRVNRSVLAEPVAEIHRYKYRQVAVLSLTYLVTFGGELAVVSMLPLFFRDTFELSLAVAGVMAAAFAGTNLIARPGGGWLSDQFGRKRTLLIILGGVAAGYFAMALISAETGILFAVIVTVLCSLFVNAGNGAVYAVIPMVKRRLTGQIAATVGAYGNVGGVVFLTVLSLLATHLFFIIMALTAIMALAANYLFLEDPKGAMAEVMPDGSVTLIEIG